MQKITVTRALSMIKSTEERLKSLTDAEFTKAVLAVEKDSSVNKEFVSKSKSNFDAFNDLFKQLIDLKITVQKSNLETFIRFRGLDINVASAIVLKNSLELKTDVLSTISRQNLSAEKSIKTAAESLERKVREFVEKYKAEGSTLQEVEEFATNSVSREVKMVKLEGFNVSKEIENLKEDVRLITSELDYLLSESNASTFVEI